MDQDFSDRRIIDTTQTVKRTEELKLDKNIKVRSCCS